MRYVYAALLLHSSGMEINEDSLTKVMESTGQEVNPNRIKTTVETLYKVNIDNAIKITHIKPVKAEVIEAPKEEEKKEDEDVGWGGFDELFK